MVELMLHDLEPWRVELRCVKVVAVRILAPSTILVERSTGTLTPGGRDSPRRRSPSRRPCSITTGFPATVLGLVIRFEDEQAAQNADRSPASRLLCLVHQDGHVVGEAADRVVGILDVVRDQTQLISVLTDLGEGEPSTSLDLGLFASVLIGLAPFRVLVLMVVFVVRHSRASLETHGNCSRIHSESRRFRRYERPPTFT